jgi:hypothetical protein
VKQQYRKKPIVVEAILWDGTTDTANAIWKWGGDVSVMQSKIDNSFTIWTLEGEMTALVGDYIIKGIQGEFYPCKPDIFEQTYEPIKGEQK